jgi:uncharacterized membrane protein
MPRSPLGWKIRRRDQSTNPGSLDVNGHKSTPSFSEDVMTADDASNDESPQTGRRYRTDRTEGISDGVFAVSLTLLILDVRPPEGGVSQLMHGLAIIAPRLGTFALSFAIVAYYWLVHHLILASVRGVKVALIWANMLFLFTIAVLPFSTALLGRYLLAPVALAIYGVNLAACTSTLAGVWFVADRANVTEKLTVSQRRYIVRRFAFQLIVALLGIACAFLAPAVALTIFVALPIVFALTYRRRYY